MQTLDPTKYPPANPHPGQHPPPPPPPPRGGGFRQLGVFFAWVRVWRSACACKCSLLDWPIQVGTVIDLVLCSAFSSPGV